MLLFLLVGCGADEPDCPEGTVRVEGRVMSFGEVEPSEAWHRPAQERRVETFCIDRFEYPNREGELPRADVSWSEAERLCRERGQRLCSSAEWELACEGESGRRYSYGSRRDVERCNTPIAGGGPVDGVPPVRPAGAFSGCSTPEGVRDLNGSLAEWVADPWTGPPEDFNQGAEVDPGTWRTLRGGTMWDRTFYGQDCTSRHGHVGGFANNDDGFRCCADPGR